MEREKRPARRRWRDYRTEAGNRPDKHFFDKLSDADAAAVVAAMREVQDLGIPAARQFVVPGTGHLDLLSSTAVYQRLHRWLTTGDESPVRSPAR